MNSKPCRNCGRAFYLRLGLSRLLNFQEIAPALPTVAKVYFPAPLNSESRLKNENLYSVSIHDWKAWMEAVSF